MRKLTAEFCLRAAIIYGLVSVVGGCGNTFRPIAGPLPQPGGDPGAQANAIVVSSAGPTTPGDTTHINVSGDTTVAIHPVGLNPVYATLSGSRVVTVNQADNTLSLYTAFGGPGAGIVTVSLQGTCPSFADARDNRNIFIAITNNSSGTCAPSGATGAVAIVSALSLIDGGETPVGIDPESLAELPNNSEVYVANKGSNDVTVVNAVDGSVTVPNIPVGTSPSYVVTSADSACVYVANQGSDSVSVIGTSSHAVISTVALPTGAGPTFMRFDPNFQRVYIANTGAGLVTVLGHNSTCVPTTLGTATVGAAPTSIAPLANGTRFYVANSGNNTVSDVDAGSFKVRRTIAVGATPVSIAASSNNQRVYTANSGAGNISIIDATDDQFIKNVDPCVSPPCGMVPKFVFTAP